MNGSRPKVIGMTATPWRLPILLFHPTDHDKEPVLVWEEDDD